MAAGWLNLRPAKIAEVGDLAVLPEQGVGIRVTGAVP